MDPREEAFRLWLAGQSYREIGAAVGVHYKTIGRWRRDPSLRWDKRAAEISAEVRQKADEEQVEDDTKLLRLIREKQEKLIERADEGRVKKPRDATGAVKDLAEVERLKVGGKIEGKGQEEAGGEVALVQEFYIWLPMHKLVALGQRSDQLRQAGLSSLEASERSHEEGERLPDEAWFGLFLLHRHGIRLPGSVLFGAGLAHVTADAPLMLPDAPSSAILADEEDRDWVRPIRPST